MAEVDQGVETLVGDHPHRAAIAAVAAVRAAEGNEFLATETGATVATVAGLDLDDGFIDEFSWLAGCRKSGSGAWVRRSLVDSSRRGVRGSFGDSRASVARCVIERLGHSVQGVR